MRQNRAAIVMPSSKTGNSTARQGFPTSDHSGVGSATDRLGLRIGQASWKPAIKFDEGYSTRNSALVQRTSPPYNATVLFPARLALTGLSSGPSLAAIASESGTDYSSSSEFGDRSLVPDAGMFEANALDLKQQRAVYMLAIRRLLSASAYPLSRAFPRPPAQSPVEARAWTLEISRMVAGEAPSQLRQDPEPTPPVASLRSVL